MKGLWHLDHQEFSKAVEYLTHPSILPTFADDIMEVLSRKADEPTLALAYYHTAGPNLTSPKAVENLFAAIAKTSVTEAFFFAREQSSYSHRNMLESLIASVLQNSSQEHIADRATELIGLPFNAEEERWFEEYLSTGSGAGLRKGKDTVLMRRIATGRFQEAVTMKGVHGKNIGGMDWNSLVDGIEKGMKTRLES